jgi:hypothetical protein
MRDAGWQRMPGPGSAYRHPATGRQVYLGTWEHGRFAWEDYAEWERVPCKERPAVAIADLPAFLTTLTAGELTTALAAVLGLDREELAGAIMVLQAEAITLE